MTTHKYTTVRGRRIFYRESGNKDARTIVLLHGFPSSSHMFRDLIPKLSDHLHVIAPDYIGFGYSDAPNTKEFEYTFAFGEQGIKEGVQVNCVVPGAVMTGRRRSFLERWAPAHNMTVEEATNKFSEQTDISRYGQPEEIADLLGFMVSPPAKWMTGTSVRMDGGEIKGV